MYTVLIKKGCSFSLNAISLLQSLNKKYIVYDYNKLKISDKKKVSELIKKQNNGKNYLLHPKIFFNNVFIGGYDELSKLFEKRIYLKN